jgi:sarcosine oxidase subunit alpha
VLARTAVLGLYDHGYAVAVERRTDHMSAAVLPDVARTRTWHIRAASTVLATGAMERPLAFPDNDRPGVMSASAAVGFAERHGVTWRSAVLATTDDTGLDAAARLHDSGTPVTLVVDVRPRLVGAPVDALRERGIELRTGWTVAGTLPGPDGAVASVLVAAVDPAGRVTGPAEQVPTELCAVNGGWSADLALAVQAGARLRWEPSAATFLADGGRQDVSVAGVAATGVQGTNPPAIFFGAVADLSGDEAARTFVDVARDATWQDVRRALGAGLRSIEHVKRFTTVGTAHDQGRSSSVLTAGLVAEHLGVTPGAVGTPGTRPPLVPVTFAALAGREVGRLSDPERRTPMHDWHVAAGAVLEPVGQWLRPWYYPRPVSRGDAGGREGTDGGVETMEQAVLRECGAVRTAVGMMDASTLGKIDVQGRDAAEFLDRLYVNRMATLRPGRARYGLMCGVDGMVFDDGVVLRLDGDHFLATTTTGGAARVLDWMEEWQQTEWPDLDVALTSVTDAVATIVVAGPRARDVVAAMVGDVDVSRDAMAYLDHAPARIAGVEGRVVRVSFSGELAFELMVPAWFGLHVWDAALAAGTAHGITPYGTEAMHVLRAEKGYVIVGQDTDGTQTPADLGMSWMVRKQGSFLGRRSLDRSDTGRPGRKQLVGLLPVDPRVRVPEGAQLVVPADLPPTLDGPAPHPVPMAGHVTSSYLSAELGRGFALALLEGGALRHGERLVAVAGAEASDVEVTGPVFVDPEGTRRDG